MMWAIKRQLKYFFIVLGVILLIVFGIIYPKIFEKETCFDGKFNNNEVGIDCGGTCSIYCESQVSVPVVVWSRAFPVTANIYNLAAYVENPNKSAAVALANYEFRIYDTNNKLLGRKEGRTYIPPSQQFVVFDSRFNSGESQIKSITFQFLPPLIWEKKEQTISSLPIKVDNIVLDNNVNLPSLTARIKNESIYDLPFFDVVGIIYDIENNAVNVSKSEKEGLVSNGTMPVFFTWPEVLSGTPIKSEILVQINPFDVSF